MSEAFKMGTRCWPKPNERSTRTRWHATRPSCRNDNKAEQITNRHATSIFAVAWLRKTRRCGTILITMPSPDV